MRRNSVFARSVARMTFKLRNSARKDNFHETQNFFVCKTHLKRFKVLQAVEKGKLTARTTVEEQQMKRHKTADDIKQEGGEKFIDLDKGETSFKCTSQDMSPRFAIRLRSGSDSARLKKKFSLEEIS
ncbi:hypothetical protein QQP08_024390 [Theobroma cacao]|nr:hypothetical protein QQP08_024390 [Theobroma cacao]